MKIEDFNFAGHKAIVRVDFNVHTQNCVVTGNCACGLQCPLG